MSAAHAIFFGTALGLATAAAALAQDLGASVAGGFGSDASASANVAAENDQEPALGASTEAATGASVGGVKAGDATAAIGTDAVGNASIAAVADDLVGVRVYDLNEEWIGEVSKVLPSTGASQERVVIDIGGFLGFGETPVEVDANDLVIAWTESGEIDHTVVAKTEAQLKQKSETDS